MPVVVCPRCHRANPDIALFCHFDGIELKPGAGAALHKLQRDFLFPSGRRCQSFGDFAQACQDEWQSSRDLLKKGVFGQFLTSIGRLDLARAAQEAMAQSDPDIALTRFLEALPVAGAQVPRLDLNPRRILLGNMVAGETRQIQLTVSNQGQGTLQGMLKVTEGYEWFKLVGGNECAIRTAREQTVTLQADTRKIAAAQSYGAKITVITNGGVVEVPVRMDLVAQAFTRSPFQGAKTPREMAVLMRGKPKQAVPLLENGEIGRWFEANGWNYPVRGVPARGVAGVQQFFEAMGLSKPPPVLVSQPEVQLTCHYPGSARAQITIHTPARKWVYASVESDSPWLRVLTPQPFGPQQATIGFEADARQVPGARAEGRLNITANAGQTLAVRVGVEVRGTARPRRGRGVLQPVFSVALAFLVFRLLLVPVADFLARDAAVRYAAHRAGMPIENTKLEAMGGWLSVPWHGLLLGTADIGPATPEFRHYLVSHFLRTLVLWTWWLGAVWGALTMLRRGGPGDMAFGIVAGSIAGVALSATLTCGFLMLEMVPLALWSLWGGGNLALLLVWVLIAVLWWTLLGAVAGLALGWVAPLRRTLLAPVQTAFAGLCRIFGLGGLASYCAPA